MAPYYQPVLDAISQQPDPWLEMVRELCEAVEAENGPKIVLLTRPLVRTVQPRMPPIEDLPPEVFYETMARMLFIGEHQDLMLLLGWYERLVSFSSGRKAKLTENWVGIFEFVTLPPPNLPEKELDRQLTRITTALRCVLAVHASAIAEDGPLPNYNATGELPPGSFGTGIFGPTLVGALGDGIRKLVLSWMAVHQQFLDAAWEQLGSKAPDRGQKLLALRARWHQVISLTFDQPRHRNSKRLVQLGIQLAKIQYGRSPHHRYLDAFVPHEAREFGFTPYDREPQDEPSGKSIWLAELIRARRIQLYFLLDEYGEYYPPDAAPRTTTAISDEKHRKATFAARRKLIDQVEKRATSLRLATEDDLVSFGCAFFQALLGATAQPSPGDRWTAWNALLEVLDLHLKTHTTQTEFNLDEDPPYFDRFFPRAINGGALHDCGVYAVHLAFVFLSLADCVKAVSAEAKPPRVSFLMLPLHVGLIVEIDDFPPLVVHNNILFRLTEEQLGAARTEWNIKPETTDPGNPALRDQKFLEDVAAQMFLRDVDLPLLRLPISPVSAPPRKPEIWKAYRQLVVKKIDRLFSHRIKDPGRPEFQFDTRFLAALTLEKRWHDATVVPFWNEGCFGLWNRSKDAVRHNMTNRREYANALAGLLKSVEDSYDKEIRPKKKSLTEEFRANPELLGPEAKRITTASRLSNFASALGPVGEVRQYLAAVRDEKKHVPVPPFATEAELLPRHGD